MKGVTEGTRGAGDGNDSFFVSAPLAPSSVASLKIIIAQAAI